MFLYSSACTALGKPTLRAPPPARRVARDLAVDRGARYVFSRAFSASRSVESSLSASASFAASRAGTAPESPRDADPSAFPPPRSSLGPELSRSLVSSDDESFSGSNGARAPRNARDAHSSTKTRRSERLSGATSTTVVE